MKLDTIYLIHNSHTDIGYTLEQPILWEMQRRFIDAAIDAAERHADHDGDHAFKWVVETVAPFLYWLERSDDRLVARLLALEKAGRIEVTGSFLNVTPLADLADYIEMLQPLARLRRDYGLTITHAMSADINGHNWTLTDALLDAGIATTSMAINEEFGGSPFTRPNVFRWQAPSGRLLPALNGWCYPTANWLGLPTDTAKLDGLVPAIERKLGEARWPFRFALVQGMAYGGDNSTADIHFSDFIAKWNALGGRRPRLRMITWREFWAAVRPKLARLPVCAGDWSDYWNFGAISSARETAIARTSRARLRTADLLHGWLHGLGIGGPDDTAGADLPGRDPRTTLRTAPEYRRQAWHALGVWHEHTWGSYDHAWRPDEEFGSAQWHHKAKLAYEAHSLGLLLARDGAAELGIRIARGPDDALILFNPLPWPRTAWGEIVPPTLFAAKPELRQGEDPSASRHGQDTPLRPCGRLEAVAVPAAGYTVVPRDRIHESPQPWARKPARGYVHEDEFRRITFDRKRGGIVSWYDKRLRRELTDAKSAWRFGTLVHEAVGGEGDARRKLSGPVDYSFGKDSRCWHPGWPAVRGTHVKLLRHGVYRWPDATEVEQTVTVRGLPHPVTFSYLMPKHEGTLEIRAVWDMGLNMQPESTYVALPFAIPGAKARFDVGWQAVEPGRQQLPGCCRDYFNVQNWVDFAGKRFGVTIATPENPLCQLGDFHFADDQRAFRLERALFLGWVTSNYWSTNFRGRQPGRVWARYAIRPYAGAFDEAAAHRFGMEAAAPCIPQACSEVPRPERPLPPRGTLLALPAEPVQTLQVSPAAWAGAGEGILVRLVNASDEPRTARIGSGLLRVERAVRCDLFGAARKRLPVKQQAVAVALPPRGMAVLRLEVSRAPGV